MIVLESEKQISVDPMSVQNMAKSSISRFMSFSQPNSPCSDLAFLKNKKKFKLHEGRVVQRQHSVALLNLERLRENHLRRSKSCGEGRACQPSLDFDVFSSQAHKTKDMESRMIHVVEKRGELAEQHKKEEKFTCGACLFLPGLGKGKTVRARREAEVEVETEAEENRNAESPAVSLSLSHSQRISLEKFECGSWRSSGIVNGYHDGISTSTLFFDLPVELLRCSSVNGTETMGFMFDEQQQQQQQRKGVLKSSGSTRKPQDSTSANCNSSRHVRFSCSSPRTGPVSPTSPNSCITPRLHKARDDFNAFLEAQSA